MWPITARKVTAVKKLNYSAALVCTVLASAYAAQPSAAASVEESSVFYQAGTAGATRQPRSSGAGQLVTIPGSVFTPAQNISGPSVPVSTAPAQTVVVGAPPATTTYGLVYVSITGGAGGGITVFPDANGNTPFSVDVPLDSPPQNIFVQNVYFPIGGPGGPCPPNQTCSTAADIDEGNETSGGLADDTFVNAFIPPSTTPNATLTGTGNKYGSVDTTSNSVRISALNPPVAFQNVPIAGNFDRWVTGKGGTISSSNNQDLDVSKQSDDYAIALYRSPCSPGYQLSQDNNITQCLKIVCPSGQSFSTEWNKCLPNCANGEVFNPTTNKCVFVCPEGEICGVCPATCVHGCYLFRVGQTIGICKP